MKKTSVPATKPPAGFAMWMDPYRVQKTRPSDFEFVEIWRAEWDDTKVISPASVHPMMNVYGLYWRPVKAFGEDAH